MIFLFYLFLCLIYKKKYLGVQIIIPHLKELNPFYTVLLSIPYDSQFLLVCLLLALWWFSPPVALTLLTPAHGKSPPPSLAWPVCFLIDQPVCCDVTQGLNQSNLQHAAFSGISEHQGSSPWLISAHPQVPQECGPSLGHPPVNRLCGCRRWARPVLGPGT